MSKCIECAVWFCAACWEGECDCTHPTAIAIHDQGMGDNPRHGRGYKRDAVIKDEKSTGRKRAAVLYPLDPDAECEWKNKDRVGGGPHPIEGCKGGTQQARHHGPDKNTLNNDEGNVHRICHMCHVHWHNANDKEIDGHGDSMLPIGMSD